MRNENQLPFLQIQPFHEKKNRTGHNEMKSLCDATLKSTHRKSHAIPVVHFDVSFVEVELMVLAVIYPPRKRIPRVAGHVVRQHEHDVRVRDAQAPHRVVHRQGVGHVPVVEPEARCAHLYRLYTEVKCCPYYKYSSREGD